MAWTLLNHTNKVATAGFPTSVTTAAMNTTGADLLVAILTDQNDPDITFTDSAGNTWSTALAIAPPNLEDIAILYCRAPTTSAAHTFTFPSDGFGNNPVACVMAFKGGLKSGTVIDQTNSFNTALGTTTINPGSITPTKDGELIITGLVHADVSASVVGATLVDNIATGATNLGTATAWIGQSAAAAINPTWTLPSGSGVSCLIVSFFANPQIKPFPWMATSGAAQDMTGGMRN